MSDFQSDKEDCTDIKPRLRRALEEPISVVSTDGTPITDDDASIVSVESHSGESYTVDVRAGRCDCPDARYNLDADQHCKHQIRAQIALGRSPVPVRAVEAADVDPTLGAHTDASVQFATADGGIIDGETGDLLDEDEDEPRFTYHNEPAEVGGAEYVRCKGCGNEVVPAIPARIHHKEDCKFAGDR